MAGPKSRFLLFTSFKAARTFSIFRSNSLGGISFSFGS